MLSLHMEGKKTVAFYNVCGIGFFFNNGRARRKWACIFIWSRVCVKKFSILPRARFWTRPVHEDVRFFEISKRFICPYERKIFRRFAMLSNAPVVKILHNAGRFSISEP